MTHDPHFVARLQGRRNIVSLACVYDFIPYEFREHYLRSAETSIAYHAALACLRRYDWLCPISKVTKSRLDGVLSYSASRIVTTGVALRPSFPPRRVRDSGESGQFRILVPSGREWRKNPEVVVRAHAASACLQSRRVRLTVLGVDGPTSSGMLGELAERNGGDPSLLEFPAFLDDAALCKLYRDSTVVVVPSLTEGFSIPVIEASSQGVPVLASDCGAHAELVQDPMDRFCAHDHERLRYLLEEVIGRPASLEERRARQAGIWEPYTRDRVCDRFWSTVLAAVDSRMEDGVARANVLNRKLPRIAFLSPMPPARSGCAEYSAATLKTLSRYADVSLFSEYATPELPNGVVQIGAPYTYACVSSKFDAVLSVLGNSHFHRIEFDLLLSYGAACISHDSRLLNFYWHEFGAERTANLATAELGEPVGVDMIDHWLANPGTLPTLHLSEVVASSRPLLVHSPITADLIQKLYGCTPVTLPFVPYRNFSEEEIMEPSREVARNRLGLSSDTVVLATFGFVSLDKAPGEVIWALEQTRSWGYDARLVFVGHVDPLVAAVLERISRDAGVEGYVFTPDNTWEEAVYRDWLIAADVAVQLRTYQLGGLSGGLLDCIAAGLPTVANNHLARAVGAPDYISRVADGLSAVRIAEEIANILDRGTHRRRPLATRRQELAERNFETYCTRLLNALGLD